MAQIVEASIYPIRNIGPGLRVHLKGSPKEGEHVYIAHLVSNWKNLPGVKQIEMYKVTTKGRYRGLENFVGYAEGREKAKLTRAFVQLLNAYPWEVHARLQKGRFIPPPETAGDFVVVRHRRNATDRDAYWSDEAGQRGGWVSAIKDASHFQRKSAAIDRAQAIRARRIGGREIIVKAV